MELLKGFLGGELDMQILCPETVNFSLENKKARKIFLYTMQSGDLFVTLFNYLLAISRLELQYR